ncbi:MAG: methylenetetrahydrofolate--tRNA-(uracil(54)-C(5))-methyltransferase (FADH(2)-oxidizing) TrmFO [Planctomycetes bacterium]|nr:methylenetetrahydrofolate--tRNA-(uracil(54)-C(5))-methyltransferase (FADH(2)-oxidizing) TrmFO [Planctomycetota bacterium]
MSRPIPVIGAGLAGSEAALQIADAGYPVRLYEMRPVVPTAAHQSDHCAELVCSNSLGSKLPDRAGGCLQAELRALDCKLLPHAEATAVPAGQALAVDRNLFGARVTKVIKDHPNIELAREEAKTIPDDAVCVIATGPLTSEALANDIQRLAGTEHLAFFDAIAPVVHGDSIDRSIVFAASRWGKGTADYLNVPLDEKDYNAFIEGLLRAEKHELKGFEAKDPRAHQFFERCLPIEILAARGHDTLRFGPMRPVGLDDPRTDRWPYAVLQLRTENTAGTLWNMVGFQTNLRYGEQERIFRALPGMASAEFARLGSMHRNTFLNSPKVLSSLLEWRERPGLFFAGQITGMEGYLGNIGSGLVAGQNAIARLRNQKPRALPRTTLLGALTAHVAESPAEPFQPMKAEFGLLPPLPGRVRKKERKAAYAARSAANLAAHLRHNGAPTAPTHP